MLQPKDVCRIDQFIAYWARATPTACACVLGDERISYSGLQGRVDMVAKALLASGIKKGDRVATMSPPNPDFLICFLAATSIGAIWVGLNPLYRIGELQYVIEDCEPAILFSRTEIAGQSYTDAIGTLLATTPGLATVIALDSPAASHLSTMKAFAERGAGISDVQLQKAREEVDGHDPCLIVYTSGSTGRPKGAMLHHHGIARFATTQNEVVPITPLIALNYFPINHVSCVCDISMPILASGGTIVFLEKFDARTSLQLMEKEGVTFWASVASTFLMQLSLPDFETFDLSAVQVIGWGGAAAPEPLIRRLLTLAPLLMTNYGMTETMISTALAPTTDIDLLANSVGSVFPGVELKLIQADGTEAPIGDAGEIWVRSEYNLIGYWGRPEATADAITADGFFKTGDLAVRRADGNYRIAGRIKEMYKSGGYNVYPREIEAALEEHPSVEMAAVISVPDTLWQEIGIAYIVTRDNCAIEDIERHCRARLAKYKVPKHIVTMPGLPLLPNGKIDKMSLKKRGLQTA